MSKNSALIEKDGVKFEALALQGCYLITPLIHGDSRGYFFESYRRSTFDAVVGQTNFIQDNESLSGMGVLRGFHFQTGDKAQAKLVRVIRGRVRDFIVDLRRDSVSFGQVIQVELSAENQKQLFVPRGFGHAFLTMENDTIFSYKVDNDYDKDADSGINFFSKQLLFERHIKPENALMSNKDQQLNEFDSNKIYF